VLQIPATVTTLDITDTVLSIGAAYIVILYCTDMCWILDCCWSVRARERSSKTDIHQFSCVRHSYKWSGENITRWEGKRWCWKKYFMLQRVGCSKLITFPCLISFSTRLRLRQHICIMTFHKYADLKCSEWHILTRDHTVLGRFLNRKLIYD